ncbi:helix-turn-helix protein [Planktotalea frisia]|jgi:transcriptional regulator with XRE-family HTH domain|uniref:Transcriptional repressor DicA n=1 Tax=Planktotalea frisia TaxID=696762 RepID=A0A1L9P171_9RHOB|nr:helix-turn-helix transcriptional regulator [Planktotalea frisia]OJI95275.1 transcriptional repressor DicA [Planktotalea frisia]PZX20196.1 helix-turn-helix protein [Planktotalea frisia]
MDDIDALNAKPITNDDMAADDWYGPDAATFGDRLAAARDNAKMTQAQMARRLGIKASTLKAWEQDLSEPRANHLSIMAGVLNVSMMWLMNGEGEGLDAPNADGPVSEADLGELLRDMRDLRVTISQSAEQLGRLEKRLRGALKSR